MAAYYLIYKGGSQVGDKTMMFLITICTVLRSSTIAGKYATFAPKHIQKIKKKKLSDKEIAEEFMAGSWYFQDSRCISSEVTAAIKRQNIDTPLFYIAFMNQPPKELSEELENIKQTIFKDDPYPLIKIHSDGQNQTLYYNGKVIIAYLLQKFNKWDYKILLFLSGMVSGILYSSVPGLIRVAFGETFHGTDTFSNVVTYLIYFNTTFLVFATSLFYTRYNVDMRRRRFLLQQLGMMVSPIK